MPRHSFRVGQYNILANCLADNLKPWFWYGYAGIQEGIPYRDDKLTDLRIEVFGYGRSKLLIEFWILMKRFFKLFHTDFDYVLHTRSYPEDSAGATLIPILHRAFVDFFHRNNATSPEGNKDLPYHLFQQGTPEYTVWRSVAQQMGLVVSEEGWPLLCNHRQQIEESTTADDKKCAIDRFNEALRRLLTQKENEEQEQILEDRLRQLANFVCPSDLDLNNIFGVQASWTWPHRSIDLLKELQSSQVDIWGIEELDELDQFQKGLMTADLSPGAVQYKLAVFKLRAIFPKEDGAGIFYNPSAFHLKTDSTGKPVVGCARYSGQSELMGNPAVLQRIALPFKEGVIATENEPNTAVTEGPTAVTYVFTDRLKPNDKDFFDERVAVFAAFTHIASKEDIIVAATHLYHTQDNPLYENIRGMETKQLDLAMKCFAEDYSLQGAPMILLGDLNDTPNVSYFGRPSQATPMYRNLVEEGPWEDCVGSDHWPTTFTLRRQLPIDYILLRRPSIDAGTSSLTYQVDPPRKVQLVGCDAKGCKFLLPYGETKGAVFGPPLLALSDQPAIPSDHVPVTATFHFDAP